MGIVRQLREAPTKRRSTLAILAHHSKGDEVVRLACVHRSTLNGMRLVATRAVAWILGDLRLDAEPLATAPDGGLAQVAAVVIEGTVDAVIVLRDSMSSAAQIGHLVSLCDVCEVPLATNRVTAEILLRDMARRSWAERGRISHPSVFSAYRFPWDPPNHRIPEAE